ncbi:ATP-binding protein [Sulfurimonas sp. SAG-AH-194-C20]|nr:ATP-binding protein [Sulfurimonas sp. SAG-AH-194-C20]MDF1878150.1 ATP-binding protein [Sulfurimonas sp. SAG-AH-194-C20]
MKNCVGQVVRGSDFWNRTTELETIWDAIDSGSHILLVAPRRVGKTSIMHKIKDEPKDGHIVIYIDTESADTENEFWHKLFNTMMEEEFVNKLMSKSKVLYEKLTNIKIIKVSVSGVEFGDGETLDYSIAFESLVRDLEIDKKLIIMIDEFAQTIENIIKYEDVKNANSLLKAHRALRQNPKVSEKVTFIYAGSIGLESVVSKISAIKIINDLNSIKVLPLSKSEAFKFVSALCSSVKIILEENVIHYLLEKIEWLIPFYIQLLIQELKTLSRIDISCPLDSTMVDEAMDKALEHRNYFESWQTKLRESFSKEEYLFAKDVLNIMSQESTMQSSQIINIGAKHSLDEDEAKDMIRTLVYDGYINNNEDNKVYRYNSPILRQWWNKNVAN